MQTLTSRTTSVAYLRYESTTALPSQVSSTRNAGRNVVPRSDELRGDVDCKPNLPHNAVTGRLLDLRLSAECPQPSVVGRHHERFHAPNPSQT